MVAQSGRTVFDTELGVFGIAWTRGGLCRVCLPGDDGGNAERRLSRTAPAECVVVRSEAAWPGWVRALVADIRRYASGEKIDFSHVPLELSRASTFHRSIYVEALKLGFGEVATYGELAARAGHATAARETGQAMGSNPVPLVVPCHRVLAAGRKLGGFSAPGGGETKMRLLALEGVRLGKPQPDQIAFSF